MDLGIWLKPNSKDFYESAALISFSFRELIQNYEKEALKCR